MRRRVVEMAMSEKSSAGTLEALTQNAVVPGNGLAPWQCRILVLDPDAVSRVGLAASVSTAGFPVDTAPSLESALRLHKFEPFHIVLSHCPLPGADVHTVCRSFRGRNAESHVYVMTLMDSCTSSDVVSGLGAGADDVLAQGANPEILLARIGAG